MLISLLIIISWKNKTVLNNNICWIIENVTYDFYPSIMNGIESMNLDVVYYMNNNKHHYVQ